MLSKSNPTLNSVAQRRRSLAKSIVQRMGGWVPQRGHKKARTMSQESTVVTRKLRMGTDREDRMSSKCTGKQLAGGNRNLDSAGGNGSIENIESRESRRSSEHSQSTEFFGN